MEKTTLTKKIKIKAQELGFGLVGVTTPEQPAHLDVYEDWIKAGHHGEMGYLDTARAIKGRADPRLLLPECQSILVLGMPYSNPKTATSRAPEAGPKGRVAAYAWGDDYHDVLKATLKELVTYIEKLCGVPVPNRWYTDTGPILESELAQRAGLGWIGKNSLLINPSQGSYFLLAEILLGIELEADQAIVNDYCGSCTRCIDACPTDCILPNRTLDAKRCISYLSIELKDVIPADTRPMMENWVFGCDICQEVCPWNIRFAPGQGHDEFEPREGIRSIELEKELELSPSDFNKKFKGSPVKRTKRRGYLRNVAVALGNAGQTRSVPALKRALLNDDEKLIRGHSAWALGEIGGTEAKASLDEAEEMEEDPWVKEEISSAQNSLD